MPKVVTKTPVPKVIDSFTGVYCFLSNFYSVGISYQGVFYPSVEHAYQASKTINVDERLLISRLSTPGAAKKRGQKVEVRPDWEQIKVKVMKELLIYKFTHYDPPYDNLKQKLLKTGTADLVEGNTWGDTFWGVCKGKGQNMLGKLLMEVREYAHSN